jgi:N6-adenosine-specific RNA methylase IME4
MDYEFHPLANLFPLIEGDDFAALVADIAAHGIHQPIDLYQGKILDGRNRYRAALAAEVEIGPQHIRHFRPELYGDPLAYVISQNLKRRHLNESQRAFVAAKLANLGEGRPEKTAPIGAVSQADAADRLAVSRRSVQRAAEVQDHGVPELQRAVETGKLSVSQAAIACRLSQDRQEAIAREAEAGRLKVVRAEIKRDLRAERERELAEQVIALPTRRYGVIVADPEWRFEPWSRKSGLDRAADNHYPTSSTEVIAARDVPSIAAPDCVLLLWATVPMLPQALVVMGAWGFDYVSHVVWRKDRIGTGYWFRNQHELVLVGTRGKPPAPAPGTNVPSIFDAPVTVHSAKPDYVLELIERWYPSLPKIELNRRGPARPGWDAWGNEAGGSAAPETGESPATTLLRDGSEPDAGVSSPRAAPVTDLPDIPNFLRRRPPGDAVRSEP